MQIEITVHAPQLAEAIYALAKALEKQTGTFTPAPAGQAPAQAKTTSATSSESGPQPTLEQVRAKLAALSQNGKQAEVKQIISDFGASKLTEIAQEHYAEVLAKAEAIS